MKKHILIVLLVFIPTLAFAQININRISIEYGYVKNYQSDFGNDKLFALSPEIKVGGNFLKEDFEWDFGISYWKDGITEPFPIGDGVTYSYSSTNLGLRLNYFPVKILLPIHFISGISTRFVNEEYIDGRDLSGNYRNPNSFILYTYDFGAGLNLKIVSRIRARLDGMVIMPINKKENIDREGWGGSLKLGIDYFIN